MTALNLKLYYLRTREKQMSQQAVADALQVRQATLSHLERGQSSPTSALLLMLCHFYDVTPTWLLDDARDVPPLPSERWSRRNSLATAGMWIEVHRDELVELEHGRVLCPVTTTASTYDEHVASLRRAERDGVAWQTKLAELTAQRSRQTEQLAADLAAEQNTHPRQRASMYRRG